MKLYQELIDRDYSRLPEKYWSNQNLCWYLHDVIATIFTEVIDEKLFNTDVDFKSEQEAMDFKNHDDKYKWLKENGKTEEFTSILCKDLFMRLLDDFLNYMHEVLSNLERGKVTVACDLLRKPFKDNLLYIEWILFNEKEISNLVYNGDIEHYALGGKGLSKKYIRQIVLYSSSINRFINNFNSKELEKSIYDIRYNYNSPNSLELVWNRATHLVTTYKKIRTEDFNFIYNNEIDHDNYLDYLYGKIPLLLLYTVGVVENIFDKYFRKIGTITKAYNFTLIVGKFFVHNKETLKFGDILLNINDNKLYIPCENCKKLVLLEKPDSYIFYHYWNVTCPICKDEINICRYFFLD